MTVTRPTRAMVLAAGLGTRMRPITETLPKPLVPVAGKPLLDYALDRLASAGVQSVVVNVHHLADQVERHVAGRTAPAVILSDERAALLETGGGVTKALPHLGEEPFLLLNSDSFWIEGMRPNLEVLAERWDDGEMDGLLLLASTVNSVGYDGTGDFEMESGGRLSRRVDREVTPFVYSGVAMLHPRLFEGAPEGAFSLNLLFDRAIEAGRLYGVRMDGIWLHVGTPQAIGEAEEAIGDSAL
ncbi:nucleotidyltransferase family protein [Breoghania sp. L-A4]|uniref:nucleotidyltransferase family protein n=1 Tax=Breoghania sp. L-A4 TaxID=2304600 RepID=UPI000E358D70|nr:nucleotidyltransferase family protein [Breoghania sp. L-A4]AXS39075.1 nucleotidyltransferase family protein [Breoghania sp. L-A4]